MEPLSGCDSTQILPPTSFQYFLANRQHYPGALEQFSTYQELKKDEYPVKILGVDTYAVVAHGKDPFLAGDGHSRNVYARGFGTAVFDGVADEVLKYL